MKSGLRRFARFCQSPVFRCLPWFPAVHKAGQAVPERAPRAPAAFLQRAPRRARTANRRALAPTCGARNPPGRAEEPRRVETDPNTETAVQHATMLRYDVANCIDAQRAVGLFRRDGRRGAGPGPLPRIHDPNAGITSTAEGDSAEGGPSGPSPAQRGSSDLADAGRHALCFSDDGGGRSTQFGRRRLGAGR
jgi:hypothetical protein